MNTEVKKITKRWLQKHNACEDQIKVFAEEWPKGAAITLQNCLRGEELGLNIEWLVFKILPKEPWARYEAEKEEAWARYEAEKAPALARYEAEIASAETRYEAEIASAETRYEAERAKMFFKYLKNI